MRTLPLLVGLIGLWWTAPAVAQDQCGEYVLAPDSSALTILFDDFTVDGAGAREVTCSLDVALNLPKDMSLGVYRVDYRGYANLAKKEVATLEVNYVFGTKDNGRRFKRSVRGANDEDFSFRENIGAGLMKRVGCGVDAKLHVDVALSLEASGESMATLDSTDGAARRGLVYLFDLKKCS